MSMDNPNPAERADFEKQTNELSQKYMTAFLARDVATISDLFTDDIRLMPPGSPMLTGTQGLPDFLKHIVSKGYHKIALTSQEKFGPVGDMGGERVIVQFESEDGKMKPPMKALHIYQKVGGKWKIRYDCWNLDAPDA